MKSGQLICMMCEKPQREGMQTCSHKCSMAYQKTYQKTDKYKVYRKAYQKTDKYKTYQKTDKYKAYQKAYRKAYYQRKKLGLSQEKKK